MQTQLQRSFLLHEFATLAINGAFQHVAIYAPGVPEADRAEVRDHLRDHLDKVSVSYFERVTETAHVTNIVKIANSLSRRHAGLLKDKTFRLGPTQKALNLYLKYLWCDQRIPVPPHCPIDSTVLAAAKVKVPVPWSLISEGPQYTNLIAELKVAAGGASLAEWELGVWGRQ
jgi:hypothetical protein